MNWALIATVGIPGVIVIAGWFLAHWLTAKRELAGRRREARIKSLEAAYMRIATVTNRDLTTEAMQSLETFVAEIQLYGTPLQVELMQKMVEGFKAGGVVSHDALLESLRDTIRAQLELEPLAGPVWWMRFGYVAPKLGANPVALPASDHEASRAA